MMYQFSLGIATMKRWSFLKESLPKYLQNPYIGEIIISDETGEDYDMIKSTYASEPKIKVYKNEKRLGAFLNKCTAMQKASYPWIVLMDSDNFADTSYFDELFKSFDPFQTKRIYMPSKALPHFDYSSFSGLILTPKVLGDLIRDKKDTYLTTSFNTGNYVLSKIAADLLYQYKDSDLSKTIMCCDVIYANTLLLMNGFDFYVVPNMQYDHVVHDGSFYFENIPQIRPLSDYIHQQFIEYVKKA